MLDLGILILRLVFGLGMAAHGAQKLFGWFGGYGIAGTGGWLESIGVKPGRFWAAVAGLGEFVGGLLLALGLWVWLGAGLISIVMLTAIAKVHLPKGYWNGNGGYELNLAILAAVIAIALIGPGAYSLQL